MKRSGYQFQLRLGVHRRMQVLISPDAELRPERIALALRETTQQALDFNPSRPTDVTYRLKPRTRFRARTTSKATHS